MQTSTQQTLKLSPRAARLLPLIPKAVTLGIVISLVIGCLIAWKSGQPLGERTGGDFIAFYGAGKTILAGKGAELYNPQVQAEFQKGLAAGFDGDSVQYFPYPAFFALPFVALATLSLPTALLLYSCFLLYCLALSGIALSRLTGLNSQLLACSFASFVPISIGLLGGQNTAISVLLISLIALGVQKRNFILSGASAAALCFKPQIALPFLLYLLLKKEFKALGWAALFLVLLFLFAASFLGADWPLQWLHWMNFFRSQEVLSNQSKFASIFGALQSVLGRGVVAAALEYGLAVAAACFCLWSAKASSLSAAREVGLLALTLPFLSFHLQFYDLGILALGYVLLFAERLRSPQMTRISIALLLSAPAMLLLRESSANYSLPFGYALLCYLVCMELMRRERKEGTLTGV